MGHKFDSVIDSSFEDFDNVVAKFRRLKIQENLLVKNINKVIPTEYESVVDLPILYCLEFKQFSKKIKDSFADINIKFEDIKAEAEEKISYLDIETMKNDVIKLDDKIRTFKSLIHTELMSTLSKEEELTKAVHDVEEKQTSCLIKPKSKSKLFNHTVPSPVKVLIKSPFKCKEVQDLQEFMMNSPNRHGGWNEYNHNIFVQIWQKHFNADITKDVFEVDVMIGNSDNFEAFQKEVLHKIAGSTKEDIVSHRKWYSKYLYLKGKQQNALNKWRTNQRILTKSNNNKHQGDQMRNLRNLNRTKSFNSNTSQTVRNIEDFLNAVELNDAKDIASALCNMSFENEDLAIPSETDMNSVSLKNVLGDTNKKKRSNSSNGGILKPTQQWTNRCNSSRDSAYSRLETDFTRLKICTYFTPQF